jgi:hypothetical protein
MNADQLTSMTRAERIPPATSMGRHSWVKSWTTVRNPARRLSSRKRPTAALNHCRASPWQVYESHGSAANLSRDLDDIVILALLMRNQDLISVKSPKAIRFVGE